MCLIYQVSNLLSSLRGVGCWMIKVFHLLYRLPVYPELLWVRGYINFKILRNIVKVFYVLETTSHGSSLPSSLFTKSLACQSWGSEFETHTFIAYDSNLFNWDCKKLAAKKYLIVLDMALNIK